MKNLNLLNYSAKCVVVYGSGTKDHKEALKQMGGKWNGNLTHPQGGFKFGGWIYSMKQIEAVTAYVNKHSKEEEAPSDTEYINDALIDNYNR